VLSDAGKRAEYDDKLLQISQRSGVERKNGENKPLNLVEIADIHFKEGMRFYREKDYFSAVQMFQLAVTKAPENSEYYLYLAKAQTHNPKWIKRAEENLLKAIELEPFNTELNIALGRLYSNAGLNRRAAQRFQEALRLDPGRADLRAELKALESDLGTGKKSFLKGLFRKNQD